MTTVCTTAACITTDLVTASPRAAREGPISSLRAVERAKGIEPS